MTSADAADEGATPDPYHRFRQALLRSGLLLDGGVPGLYLRSGAFEEIVTGVDRLVSAAGADLLAPVLHAPPVMTRAALERSGYLLSFPGLVGSIHVFDGDNSAHAALLRQLAAGEDWSGELTPADLVLCSAVCHPIYPHCAGLLPPGGRQFEIFGTCFRHEPSVDPARMQVFRQHEFVYLGTPDGSRSHQSTWVERALSLLGSVGLDARAVVANDPFHGRVGTMLAMSQRSDALKYEVVVAMYPGTDPTALVSANCHLDHFAAAFGIESEVGLDAHTACVGFGTDRIALALLAAHGVDTDGWPASARSTLWP
jgi:seryl-tRNA synthetase